MPDNDAIDNASNLGNSLALNLYSSIPSPQSPLLSQYPGSFGSAFAQLITVRLVVYTMAMMPNTQRATSEYFHHLFRATPL